MSSIAFVFPGQGSQSVGMGRELAASSPAASATWAAADVALGEPISALAWDGPADRLDQTENAQPALLAASIAILDAWRERWSAAGGVGPVPAFAAGHSMGQYSALVATGVLSIEDGIRLVRRRGELMQSSGQGRDGAMAALIGLDDARLPELVEGAAGHGTFVVANRNAPGQVVVSGDRAAIEAGAILARELGAKRAIVLPVSVAAHSPLMAEAADAMRETLAGIEFHDPTATLLANADARPITTGDGGPGRTRRAPDRGRRLGGRDRPDDGRRGDDVRGGRTRQGPDRPHQADRTGRTTPSRRTIPPTTIACSTWPPSRPDRAHQEGASHASTRL